MREFRISDFGFWIDSGSKRIFSLAVCAVLIALCSVAQAQQEKKVARIGFLSFGSGDETRTIGPFREELRKLGWVEGTNILIDYRRAGGNRDRVREFADELVRTKVDLIVVTGSQAIAAAKAATSSILSLY